MKDHIVPTIINLLLATIHCQRQYHEVNLIDRLNTFYGFDHNIFLLDSLSDRNQYISTDDANRKSNFTPQTVYIFDANVNNGNHDDTQLAKLIFVTSKNTFLIVVADVLKFYNKSQLLTQVKAIGRLNDNVKIGVFLINNIVSMEIIEQLFRWSWSAGIVNIFCAFYSNVNEIVPALNVFRYDPFGTFDLINVSASESLHNIFPDEVPNYRNHPLRIVYTKEISLSILERQFCRIVSRVFNASIVLHQISKDNYFRNFADVDGDIMPYQKTVISINKYETYPHREITMMLLVPHAMPFNGFVAYLQNLISKHLFAYTLVVIVAASLLLTVSGYLHRKNISFFQCVANVVNLLMNDNTFIRYRQLHLADVCVIVPLTLTGMIVVNGIVSIAQSCLTSPIYERQINTIEDLFKSPVRIIVSDEFWAEKTIRSLENLSQHGGWSEKVSVVNISQSRSGTSIFGDSIALHVSITDAKVLLETHKRLNVEEYHLLTETYLDKNLVAFQLNRDFPFTKPINHIIHNLQSAGLIGKWLNDKDQQIIQAMMKFYRNKEFKMIRASDSGESTIAIVIGCGGIASVIVFVCEIIWNKIEFKAMPRIENLKEKRSMG